MKLSESQWDNIESMPMGLEHPRKSRTDHLLRAADLIDQAVEEIEAAGQSVLVDLLQRVLRHLYVLISLLK